VCAELPRLHERLVQPVRTDIVSGAALRDRHRRAAFDGERISGIGDVGSELYDLAARCNSRVVSASAWLRSSAFEIWLSCGHSLHFPGRR
jgi:hypothetical protein